MGMSAGGQRVTQSSTTSVDRESADMMRRLWGAGQAAGAAGPSPLVTGAADYGGAAQAAGNLGFGALGGSQAAIAQLMNPYNQQVIEENRKGWDQTNTNTINQINDAATRARAYGGSRHGVAEGVALSQNNLAQMQQEAGLRSAGYDQAMQQAAQLAGYGFQGAGMNANLGLGGVGSPEQWRLMMMRQGFVGPLGSATSGRSNTVNGEASFSIPFLGGKK
jgi:hypothetical protein